MYILFPVGYIYIFLFLSRHQWQIFDFRKQPVKQSIKMSELTLNIRKPQNPWKCWLEEPLQQTQHNLLPAAGPAQWSSSRVERSLSVEVWAPAWAVGIPLWKRVLLASWQCPLPLVPVGLGPVPSEKSLPPSPLLPLSWEVMVAEGAPCCFLPPSQRKALINTCWCD